LPRLANSSANQGATTVRGECAHRAMGRADEGASRQRRILRHFSAGLAVFRRSRRYFETQVQRLLYRFFKNFQAMYYSHCDGVLGADSWGEIGRTMADFIAYPGLEQWWKTRRHTGT